MPGFLAEVGRGATSHRDHLTLLNRFLAVEVGFTPDTEGHVFSAWEVLNRGRGLCGNLSEVLLYAARLLGLPYRYVALEGTNEGGRTVGDVTAEVFVDGAWQFFDPLHDWTEPGTSAADLEASAPDVELYRLERWSTLLSDYLGGSLQYATALNSLARTSFTIPTGVVDDELLYGAAADGTPPRWPDATRTRVRRRSGCRTWRPTAPAGSTRATADPR
ncbi:MAG: transglutaminase domain-containing protein [Acidimicrobiia bacterium]|nr:transglutaminase domain-containing protein [Acidimicrobiia bacterium]